VVEVDARDGRKRRLLGPISIDLGAGETIAVVGPSGSGKSTLLKLIAGLMEPSSGSVNFTPTPAGAKVVIGLAPQSPSLMPWLTLVDNVLLPTQLGTVASHDHEAIRLRAAELLNRFGLNEHLYFAPSKMSGGMQSRVALARALISRPNLLLLDEPFGSLDDVTAEAIMLDLSRFLEDDVSTTFLVSHNITQAAFLADRVLVCSNAPARIVADVRINEKQPRTYDFLTTATMASALAELRSVLRGGAKA
jgi:NitT/TauT family transport system ATP-binding protein